MTTVMVQVLAAAAFYAMTMVFMKFWGLAPPLVMGLFIFIAFALGAWCEIEALKTERLSFIYIAILGAEAVFIGLVSFAVLGESLSARETIGAILVGTGLIVNATA